MSEKPEGQPAEPKSGAADAPLKTTGRWIVYANVAGVSTVFTQRHITGDLTAASLITVFLVFLLLQRWWIDYLFDGFSRTSRSVNRARKAAPKPSTGSKDNL